jgi:histidinol-phosphate aminotransferase
MKPEDIIRDEIRALKGYHVPDASGFIKLDAMENPYRLPPDVREKIAARVRDADINRYPDAGATRVKARVLEMLGAPVDTAIVLGNGSDEIIQMLTLAVARAGAVVMSVEPSFVMFRMISVFCGLRFVGVPLLDNFEMDIERMVTALREHKPALVFLAYPNNPTGNLFSDEAIARVLEEAPGLVVIDEAYHAFAGRTYADRLGEYPNLLVMRTLSKSGLAGLRLGFVAGPSQWLDHVDKVRLPYNVGVLTQLVAEEVLQHEKLLAQQAAAIKLERTRLHAALNGLDGIRAFPSEANFILFKTAAADTAHAGLKQRGILVKNLNGSHPAVADCLRVTVGTPEENTRFLGALKESL